MRIIALYLGSPYKESQVIFIATVAASAIIRETSAAAKEVMGKTWNKVQRPACIPVGRCSLKLGFFEKSVGPAGVDKGFVSVDEHSVCLAKEKNLNH